MIDILEQIQLISRKNGLNLESQIDLENPSHHRRNSSVAEMMPDFQNQVLQAQSNLQKLNNNIEKIYQLKQEQSKTVVPNKHKGNFP